MTLPILNTNDLINQAIRSTIKTVLNYQGHIHEANKNVPLGNVDEPFGTVLVHDITPVGQDSRSLQDKGVEHQLTETIDGSRSVEAYVEFFRAGAITNASRLKALLVSDVNASLLRKNGLSFVRSGEVQNLSQVVDTYWEERAQVILEFYISSVEQLTVATFSSVTINIQLDKTTQNTSREVTLDS